MIVDKQLRDNGKGSHTAGPKQICFAGEGVLFNPAIGFELLRTAAERGDAEAQAYLGFRLALGIYPPLPGNTASCHQAPANIE